MATTGPARSSAAEQLRQGLEIDVGGLDNINSRFTSALISHSHDACLSDININSNSRKDPTSASSSNSSSGSGGGGGGGHINVSSSSDSFADLNESLASTSTSDIKSPTSKPSNNRSLPGSPYSMTDSFAPSSAGLPSSSAASYSNIRVRAFPTSSARNNAVRCARTLDHFPMR
ncbi:hypothetical protein TWF569_003414 [Orbilia oligospora]|nr:hypothetical protein TWF569_003414 [Orbilia oligospora]